MPQLVKHIIALTNLYGMVSKEKVVELYNSHHQDQISLNPSLLALLRSLHTSTPTVIIETSDYPTYPPVSKGRDLRLTGPGTSGAGIGGNAIWRELDLMSS